jgi:hypothetical protein
MTPAAYHRIVYAGEYSQDMHRVGSALVTAATAKPLDAPVTSMILLIMDFLVVWAPIRREGAAALRFSWDRSLRRPGMRVGEGSSAAWWSRHATSAGRMPMPGLHTARQRWTALALP